LSGASRRKRPEAAWLSPDWFWENFRRDLAHQKEDEVHQ
jgi:hypothetical protein